MTETHEPYIVIKSDETSAPVGLARELEIICAKENVIERAAKVVAANRAAVDYDFDPLAVSNLEMALGLLGAAVDRLRTLQDAGDDEPGDLP